MRPPASPPCTPARYLFPMLDGLRRSGFDVRPSMLAAGLDFERSGNRWVDLSHLTSLVSSLEALTGRTDLGFEVGLSIVPNSHGRLGQAMVACRDLDQILTLVSNTMHLMQTIFVVRYLRPDRLGNGLLTYTPVLVMPPQVQAFIWDLSAATFFNHARILMGEVAPSYESIITMPVPPHAARYAELAPARTRFDANGSPGIVFSLPARMLDAPFPTGSGRAFAHLMAGLHTLARRLTPTSVGGRRWGDYVTATLRQVEGPQPTIGELAQRLGISTRTIDRHLAREGLSYRDLARAQMIARARCLLMQPGASVTDVAEQLGFSDVFSFSHAFRRGTGTAPSQFQHTSPPPALTPSPAPAKRPAAPAKPSPR